MSRDQIFVLQPAALHDLTGLPDGRAAEMGPPISVSHRRTLVPETQVLKTLPGRLFRA
jgi:hypothetical protein